MSTNRRKQPARQRGAQYRAARQARRERAAELFAQGRSQAEVARELEVSRQSASRWHAGWQAEGARALQSRGPTGRRPKIPDAALKGIEQALLEGALAHGFATDVWTLDRIAVVIQGLTGVTLSNPSVWRLLGGRLGWSVQRPARQAQERDEEAIQHWVAHQWPRIKGGHAESAWVVFFDESGIWLIPPVRRSWSPRGRTPVLRHRMAWKRASMAAALGYRPDGTKARLCFHLQADSYDTDSLIGVLEQLAGFYAGQRVVLLWDGLSAHWSYKLRTHLNAQRDWLQVERLPAYAPELNPVEYLWANLKGAELANFTGDTVPEVADQAQLKISAQVTCRNAGGREVSRISTGVHSCGAAGTTGGGWSSVHPGVGSSGWGLPARQSVARPASGRGCRAAARAALSDPARS
jgi:transposase